MNIFHTDPDPIKCAQNLDSKRLIKMCLESAQILSVSYPYITLKTSTDLYKPTHSNHPANVWARENQDNYSWLFAHFQALLGEYTVRFNKTHACSRLKDILAEGYNPNFTQPTTFPNCTKNEQVNFKDLPTVDAYRAYLKNKWENDKTPPKWGPNGSPDWL